MRWATSLEQVKNRPSVKKKTTNINDVREIYRIDLNNINNRTTYKNINEVIEYIIKNKLSVIISNILIKYLQRNSRFFSFVSISLEKLILFVGC